MQTNTLAEIRAIAKEAHIYSYPMVDSYRMEVNWLPASQGPFFCVMRLYWPKAEAIDGTWQPSAMQRMAGVDKP